MHKFIKPLSDAKKRKEVEEQKQREIEIEKLKANFPLYGKVINSDDKNIAKLSVYDEKKLFKAGAQNQGSLNLDPNAFVFFKTRGYNLNQVRIVIVEEKKEQDHESQNCKNK
ncbi:hypothetical protein A1D18_00885 [Candidatus Rickettsiella isopodorum]|jgi:hypothetical protein|uniref:Uncharacterized protein n=1 Tax=Candidatus Rickettsiella isopodorum TaxID=1225476 RepID=A0A1J8NKL4_9COXI|nr:hypothetical protein [Candidatus Rickettsiella isopodorum]OIZ95961.1 hypothetical protein A1D18_00885 [Candidatus Rickettsiella isopodorum]